MNKPATKLHPVAELKALLPTCMFQDRIRIERRLNRRRRLDRKEVDRLLNQARGSARLREKRRNNRPHPTYPAQLPISDRKDEILAAIREYPVVVVAGETGSGKSTQLPKICLDANRGHDARIGITQPRRVAALSIARRIAEELEVSYGRDVGCKIRFRDQTAPETCIKVMTDGMLLAETQTDPELLEYDTIIVDEAHERSLNIDFLLGYLQLLRRKRPELKIIITSATIDTETFAKAFDDAPVIEVSGRMFPVEVRYWPLDELMQDRGDYTYIDATASAVDEILKESRQGDLLVFLPSERDIREARERLEGRKLRGVEILPLFGRLTASEQQRVFSPGANRRVILATNIAETSLTIPRIRYVVDTGLARLARYNPRTHTQRLPIETISQSSARQREGRCGRVEDGICIRLYSEQDFASRDEYTQPEIQRANLADVILRMINLKLGAIETFPFIDPPSKQAIAGGLQLLRELNALDEDRKLTSTGRDMARLPIDPTVSRMLLQAREEHALAEVLVIAAAISVQDPRERPLEEQDEADRIHRQFHDKNSDFLAYLNIWKAYHDKMESASQNQLRKFCKAHYLSYMRMREWRDIYEQIVETLGEIKGFRFDDRPADYDAIHRAVLTGLLSSIARREEGNIYQAARNREVMVFPGSGLFLRKEKGKKNGEDEKRDKDKNSGWLVAAEMVETSRLFARTVARIQPDWLEELGSHLCRTSHDQPYFNARSGRVLVREKLTLYGLQVLDRRVGYGRINAREATEIFIREALVPGAVYTPYQFLARNTHLCQKLETWQTRAKNFAGVDIEQAACNFYLRRLDDVSSLHDLNRFLKDQADDFLLMAEEDLLGATRTGFDPEAFPDALDYDGEALALSYAYCPGQDEDGITVKLPYKLAHTVDPEILEWLVPGLLEEKITVLLRALPKAIRKQLLPIPEKAKSIAARLKPTHPTFLESLQAHIRQHYRIQLRAGDWNADDLPDHLRMRIEVQGTNEKPIAAGRDLAQLTQNLEQHDTPAEFDAWKEGASQWERSGVMSWDFGDLPERIEITQIGGVPLYGWPGLDRDEEGVSLRLYKSRAEAASRSRQGFFGLCALALSDDLAWLQRELKELAQFKARYQGSALELREQAFEHLERYLFQREQILPLCQRDFDAALARAKKLLRGLAPRFISLVDGLLNARREILLSSLNYRGLDGDLQRLLPADFLARVPFEQLTHLHRYLKAVQVRAERAKTDPRKDAQKAALVAVYQNQLEQFTGAENSPEREARVEELRWMLEEYRVSVFAQELGTAHPTSPKRLDKKIEQTRQIR
ncbi:MAG: ATP-dependent RNA helicase HrpA [Candidatus Latescibacterota bacterium]|nr:ATP-dependent RNA helicase HrpA [Candidatus Latescibacterota bacterium]